MRRAGRDAHAGTDVHDGAAARGYLARADARAPLATLGTRSNTHAGPVAAPGAENAAAAIVGARAMRPAEKSVRASACVHGRRKGPRRAP